MKFLKNFLGRTGPTSNNDIKGRLVSSVVKDRKLEAKRLLDTDPERAMGIAMGDLAIADEILAAAVYAEVCMVKQNNDDVEACARIANSFDNTKLNADALSLNLMDDLSAVAAMKSVVNARRSALEKTLPKGTTAKDAVKKEAERLGAYLSFLTRYVEYLVGGEPAIREVITYLKDKTSQNVLEGQLILDLWVIRYALAHIWFLNLDSPKNQNAVDADVQLVRKAFQNVLANVAKSNYLPRLTTGFAEYFGGADVQIKNLNQFQSRFQTALAEKIPRIAFDATEGRLGGELYDGLIVLIKSVIDRDKEVFASIADR